MKKFFLYLTFALLPLSGWCDETNDVFTRKVLSDDGTPVDVTFRLWSAGLQRFESGDYESMVFLGVKIGDGENCAISPDFKGSLSFDFIEFDENHIYQVVGVADNAFKGCTGLESFSSAASFVGLNAFAGCTNLSNVSLHSYIMEANGKFYESVPVSIGGSAFENCQSLGIVSGELGSIDGEAFRNCRSLQGINLAATYPLRKSERDYFVGKIGRNAFYGCESLTSIHIPSWIKEIDRGAFTGVDHRYLDLETIMVAEDNPVYDSRDNCNALIETATGLLMRGCKKSVIPNGVKTIGECAFADGYCPSIVEIPSSVTTIEGAAFRNCRGWADGRESEELKITMAQGVKTIGDEAFYGCKSLVSADIPSTVTSIGNSVFNGCESLLSANIPSSVKNLGMLVFVGCYSLKTVDYNPNISEIPSWTFSGCKSLAEIVIPAAVERIGTRAFQNCKSLLAVDIPAKVTDVGAGAFVGCSGLESLSVSKENTIYDSRNNCNAIIETASSTLLAGCKNTIFPTNIKAIGANAFYACTGLTAVDIPEGVQSIGDGAFTACTGLKHVSLPSTLTAMGVDVFGGEIWTQNSEDDKPISIGEVTANMKAPFAIDMSVFTYRVCLTDALGNGRRKDYTDTYDYGTLYVPKGMADVYRNTEGWSRFRNIVEMGETAIKSVVSVSAEAGSRYYDLTGRSHTAPSRGLYIISTSGRTKKVLLKR